MEELEVYGSLRYEKIILEEPESNSIALNNVLEWNERSIFLKSMGWENEPEYC